MSDDGSEDLDPQPKQRIKRVILMSSSSDSDSDENIVVAGTRRKRMRVVSDADSESSGGSVICAGTRHKRTLPKLRDSDSDSDSSSWASDHSDSPKPAPVPAKSTSGFASDSSEGNSDKCSICLMRFTDQLVGTPQNCEHIFCLDCITEWSKNVNTCPVDRISFNSIVVRICAGGRVLRTEPVKVVERRPSIEWMLVEDPTPCQICGSSDNEERMLLCDGCDLGFHMQCLTPPLTEIPADQWLCPNCDNIIDAINLSEVDDLFSEIVDMDLPLRPRPVALREVRNNRRSARNISTVDEPSTSSGRTGSNVVQDIPTTSRARQSRRSTVNVTARRRITGTQRRKPRKRKTKTVIIEYEVQEGRKIPVTKTIKRKLRRRKVKKRQPRTVARRSHVMASVRAKLTSQQQRLESSLAASAAVAPSLAVQRRRAGVPALSVFGDPHQLEYFSEEERDASGGGSAAVAVRNGYSAIDTPYRQARRKMVTIPSPPHAAAAPDLLDSILESQALLHSKNSVVEIGGDGKLDIKPQRRGGRPEPARAPAGRQAPAYPGQGRTGGWGGGYRGPPREQGYRSIAPQTRGGGGGSGGPPGAGGGGGGYGRRDDEFCSPYGRRAPLPPRGPPRHAWPPAAPRRAPFPAPAPPPSDDDPLDMRVAAPRPYRPLPEPPVFKFDGPPEDEDDPDLVIDTEKYDPTEPTHDDEDSTENAAPAPEAPPAPAPGPAPAPAPAAGVVRDIMAGLDASGLTVSASALTSAVQQALSEHRQRAGPPAGPPAGPASGAPSGAPSDDDADGDCPNFSIYSATSVHFAHSPPSPPAAAAPPVPRDDLADLVQEDDSPERAASPPPAPAPAPAPAAPVDEIKKKSEDELKEKVSKRCPITTNPRNPIKIKLNSTSLMKRQLSLYDDPEDDEEEVDEGEEPPADPPAAPETADPPRADVQLESNDTFVPVEDPPEEPEEPADDLAAPEDDASEKGDDDAEGAEEAGELTPDPAPAERRPPDAGPDGADAEPPGERGEGATDDEDESEEELDSDDETSEGDGPRRGSPRAPAARPRGALEKMTESISETEDERSYTPCLDEPPRGLHGLDTELISEDEGHEMFSDEERAAPAPAAPATAEPGPAAAPPDVAENGIGDAKKRRRKDVKKDSKKDKKKTKRADAAFKKTGKGGKRRNYRDKRRGRRDSSDPDLDPKRREKRKDMERYDVRTLVTEKRRRPKDAFGRDVSPRDRSPSAEPPRRRRDRSPTPARRRSSSPARRRSLSPVRRRSPSPVRRRSPSPVRRRSPSPVRRRSPSPVRRRSPSPVRRRSPSPLRRGSPSPVRRRSSPPARRRSSSPSPGRSPGRSPRLSLSPRSVSPPRRRGLASRVRRRRDSERSRKRHREDRTPSPRVKPKSNKRRKRARSEKRASRRKSPRRRRARRSLGPGAPAGPGGPAGPVGPAGLAGPTLAPRAWSPASDSPRLPSPRTPPAPSPRRRHRRDRPARPDHPDRPARPDRVARPARAARPAPKPNKEVFTSGDNILVSVSFKDPQPASDSPERRERRLRRRERRRQRRAAAGATSAAGPAAAARPVAIIDLERSPFRELTPSPRNVIVLSDSEQGPAETPVPVAAVEPAPAASARPAPGRARSPAARPRTPPPSGPPEAPAPAPEAPAPEEARGPNTPPEPPDSPDAYDPFEPTRSASGSPTGLAGPGEPTPAGALGAAGPGAGAAGPGAAGPGAPVPMTLETAQRTNLTADDVLARRPLSPIQKVMALLQSTRDVPPDPPPGAARSPPAGGPPSGPSSGPGATVPPGAAVPPLAAAPAPRPAPPKLFLAKPSPIKSDPIKPLQRAESPYSPGSSDFGDLFEPPSKRDAFDAVFGKRSRKNHKLNKKRGKTQVGVKMDDDNMKILDDVPNSAVEMQVKSKFLRKLNRQERVVEEVKLVLKPHYNKRRVTKDEYKHILRRAVPKICHNKTGEINPTKIQALVEAYVKKFRKKHKLGLA